MKEFSAILKELRVNNNLTQEALGEIVHVSRSAIAKYENGLGVPSSEVIELLCKYFKVTKEELFPKEEVEHLIVEKNKKIKLFKILLIVLTILFSLFLCYTIYYFVNEAIIYKQDLDKNISEVEKYHNISSYDIKFMEMNFEDTVKSRVYYNYDHNLFVVEEGAKVIIRLYINQALFEKIHGHSIVIKFKGVDKEEKAYVEEKLYDTSSSNPSEHNAYITLRTYLVREQTLTNELLQIEYIKFNYDIPYLDENSNVRYETCEKINYISLEEKNNRINYFMYKYSDKEMKIYFYNDYIATISFGDYIYVDDIISDKKSTNYKYLYEKLKDHLTLLKEKYCLEFSDDFIFETDTGEDLSFPINKSFSLVIKSTLLNENIDLIIPNMTEKKVNMSLNEMINFKEVELNGSKIATNSFNISISNNNVAYKDNYNIKGIVAQNIGTSNIEVEVDLGYYKKTFNYDIEILSNCEVSCKYLGVLTFPYLEEINDYLSDEVKEHIIKQYNDKFEKYYKDITKKVIDLYRPNEYYILPIFEGDFKFESFQLTRWNNGKKEIFTGDVIEIERGEVINLYGEISEEEQEKLQLKTKDFDQYYEFVKDDNEFFNGFIETQSMFNIQIPGEYKISIIFVVGGNLQYYEIKEFTIIVK